MPLYQMLLAVGDLEPARRMQHARSRSAACHCQLIGTCDIAHRPTYVSDYMYACRVMRRKVAAQPLD